MFEDFFNELKEYAENTSYIESVFIVGSYCQIDYIVFLNTNIYSCLNK